MRGGPRDLANIERRRTQVADLYLQGLRQWEIAERVGVNRNTVIEDLNAVRQQWIARAVHSMDALKAKELERVDHLERTYWSAWERSLRPRRSLSVKETTGGKDGARLEEGTREDEYDGDPRFLQGVQWCIAERCKILGLYAPTKVEDTTPVRKVPLVRVHLSGPQQPTAAQQPIPTDHVNGVHHSSD